MKRFARQHRSSHVIPGALIIGALIVGSAVRAFAAADAAAPDEGPLETIRAALTGSAAATIAVIALFAGGAALVFGDEMSDFVKRVLIGVISLALLVAGSHFVAALNITGP